MTQCISRFFLAFGVTFLLVQSASFSEQDPEFSDEIWNHQGYMQCYLHLSKVLGKSVRFCIQRSHPEKPALKGERVVYFFHGMWGSATTWNGFGYAEALDRLTQKENVPPMTVVSFDTRWDSFFSDWGTKSKGPMAYETWFVSEFMPFIERKYGVCNHRECRAAAGVSMGGAGALKTALRHPHLFKAVAANCPALVPYNIHASDALWREHFNAHPIGYTLGSQLLGIAREVFPSPLNFNENDALWLTKHWELGKEKYPALYFDIGGKDRYGFEEGAFDLVYALRDKNIPFTFQFYPGANHKMQFVSGEKIVRFIVEHLSH